ncbi:uncharacterized protein L3040_002332 [Drepanopeziza brunnea f. sp. 'multigermtubi']|nr:hypothetical protein L3040_002332 [Drepanopeziza brunnea f. sp. 'multigermtubi']
MAVPDVEQPQQMETISPRATGANGEMTGGGRRNIDESLRYDWNGENDPRNPFNWSLFLKWRLTVAVLIVSILLGLPAGAYGAGNAEMARLFNVANDDFPYLFFATTSWNVGASIFPLILVPLTESSGRIPGYFGAYIAF